jgi:hypothetical protein
MQAHKPFELVAVLAGAVAIVAGCSTQAGSPLGSSPAGLGASRAHSLNIVTTRVEIYNSGSATILGTGSSACWTISPTPLPSVSPDTYSGVISLSYNTTCAGPNFIDIAYAPTVGADDSCTFVTTYDMGFSYSVDNSEGTACTATPSHNVAFDELFSYDPSGSLRKHR